MEVKTLKEAWYQLSEEEQHKFVAQVQEAFHKVAGKTLIQCTPAWFTEEWALCGVEEFPSVEAVQQYTEMLYQLHQYRYFEVQALLATKWPPE
ncbi:MAG: hypothetical protein JXR84_14240 [Anaerolineae bacterium]|nr:hypothetical protein [Anaerolineae bacterium]